MNVNPVKNTTDLKEGIDYIVSESDICLRKPNGEFEQYVLVRIPNHPHTIKYSDEGYEYPVCTYAYPRSESIPLKGLIPWTGHVTPLWESQIRMTNYTSSLFGGDIEVKKGYNCIIYRNGVKFWSSTYHDFEIAKMELDRLFILFKNNDLPIDANIVDFDKKLIGRKIQVFDNDGYKDATIVKYMKGKLTIEVSFDDSESEYENSIYSILSNFIIW